MSEEQVSRAARALRAAHDGASPAFQATRRSVLAAAAARKRRRSAFLAVWMPLAAVLVVSSAWAAVTGRLSGLVAIGRGTGSVSASASAPASASASAPAPAPAPAPVPASASAPASGSPTPTSSASSLEDSLYATAHRAHFLSHDPSAALAAWDSYLAAFPAGRFAPEARYNRALALLRLDRLDEARASLAPFADAPPGSYRRTEARELLDAIDSGR
jgi:hypothetical protein